MKELILEHLQEKEGYEITSEDVTFVHSITGRKGQYARYRLEV